MRSENLTAAELQRVGTGRVLRRCLGCLRPYRRMVAVSYVLLLANNGITLAMPLIIEAIVDRGIREGDTSVIGWGTALLLALALVRGAFAYLSGRWTEVASQSVAYDLRSAIHEKLQSLSFSYHDHAETGQLLARAIGDVNGVRFLTGRAFVRLVEAITLVLGVSIAMLAMNFRLGLVTLSIVPFLTYSAMDFGRRYRPLMKAIREQVAELTTRLEQNLRGARIVKAFAQERAEIERFERENTRLFSLDRKAARIRSTQLPLQRLIVSAGTILILLYGGQLIIRQELTIGEFVAFSAYVGQLTIPIRRLGMVVAAIALSATSGERIFEILDAESEVEDSPDAVMLRSCQGHVRFQEVSFGYFSRHQVLKGIDFEVKPGEVIALLGATGSGKSSVISLIPRFYDPLGGSVLLDGVDIRGLTLNSLREQIGIVLQDTTLFAGSVHENISFGRPTASREEVIAAAKAASAHDFIMELPEQYESKVGERGATLSGGQRQRIAIARAILKDPRILILDDATSSVDTETEAMIQSALSRLMKGRTCFVIAATAHRPARGSGARAGQGAHCGEGAPDCGAHGAR